MFEWSGSRPTRLHVAVLSSLQCCSCRDNCTILSILSCSGFSLLVWSLLLVQSQQHSAPLSPYVVSGVPKFLQLILGIFQVKYTGYTQALACLPSFMCPVCHYKQHNNSQDPRWVGTQLDFTTLEKY